MRQSTLFAGCLMLGMSSLNGQAHASFVKSMTIEEIGVASGGLGTSLTRDGGGRFSLDTLQSIGSLSFGSAGSTDDAILMGTSQAAFAFTRGFLFGGFLPVTLDTLPGAPRAQIENGVLTLILSSWGANVQGMGYFNLPPDPGTLVTDVAYTGMGSYFYTADWRHQITPSDDPTGGALSGLTTYWHLEGIATVPEPGTAWLVGVALLGLLGARRRKPLYIHKL